MLPTAGGGTVGLAAQERADDDPAAEDSAADQQAQRILSATGVQGGLIVHLACGDGRLTAALRAGEGYLVHGLDRDPARVEQARQYLRPLDNGPVSVDRLLGERLPYADNVVNLLVAEQMQGVPMSEVLRVLVPRGTAYIRQGERWEKTVKPRPAEIDEWTHFMHDPSGNAVAHDTVVGPPEHLQWVGSPKWSRHHDRMASLSALVSAGGRAFYIMDEGSRVSIQLPPRWTLVARDAFNGVVLWKQPIATWHSHLWPLKSGPSQLARRLVATGDRVYVTLGIDAPLSELEAATGKLVRVFEGSQATEEILVLDGVVLALVNQGPSELAAYGPQQNVGDQRRVAEEFRWNELPRQLTAYDSSSGRRLWSRQTRVAPLSLAADSRQAYFHDGERVVCLDLKSGEQAWATPPVGRRPSIAFHFGPRIVLHEGVLLFAGGDRTMRAFDSHGGKLLWSAPHAQGGYQSPEDLLVVGGLVWSAPTTSSNDSGVYTGRDVRSGEVRREFAPDVETYWFHHRCHMAKATDRFLLPSRTGIEFVDPQQESWKIHHWVRGGCLYGIMPCNGLVYAPPHNCACYPEAKLYGLSALAPASATRQVPREVPDEGRLEQGSAGPGAASDTSRDRDWPTYRGDARRSGFTRAAVPAELRPAWRQKLGGKLSPVVVAGERLYVAAVDAHTVHALDARQGTPLWSYMAGGRVDSPPTIADGRVLFGSADGWVYCLRAEDGGLIWRFRAAPLDRRLVAFEQLESVWPVHGSVLVQDGVVHCVAGRSCFLDGGLRLLRLDAATGRKLSEQVIDDVDPETGTDIQDRLQTLQMPVGLPDVLSSDGRYLYMRSQAFDLQGNRLELGPHSGQAAAQGSVQHGDKVHLFSPTGFLDDTWFHRSYWVYGRSFAGGHNGYYQAGKFAPAGRILSVDDDHVYGFGRKPQYYRWTTTLEHQLFATSKEAPPADLAAAAGGPDLVFVPKSPSLNPAGKPLTVEAWVQAERPEGVVLARGGPTAGYALVIRQGKPRFLLRDRQRLYSAHSDQRIVGQWTHLAGVLTEDKQLQLYVNGKLAGSAQAESLLSTDPAQALEIGGDDKGAVGDYRSPLGLTGIVDQVRIYHAALPAEELARHAAQQAPQAQPVQPIGNDPRLVLAYDFDGGQAKDLSGRDNHGQVSGATRAPGKLGDGLRFAARGEAAGGSLVKHEWNQDLPLLVRAMVLADKTLFVFGPPDLIDEEESFQRLVSRDPRIAERLEQQDAALRGAQGGLLRVLAAADGRQLAEYQLDELPVWDGLAAAHGRLYFASEDGQVVCYGPRE
ncbi:MAG: PQQ-binding-like beta-propeller repeat protein [Pirellulaceae bacterium]|nr:PQQ-binding-like beta-propeller repeat protein [Pirellulaceae bacterium]